MPSSRSSRARSTSAAAARRSGSRFTDLRSDVAVQADDLDAFETARARDSSATSSIGDAELVALQAGRDMRMAPGVDVRVHPKGDLRPRLPLARQRVDPLHLARRLHVDRSNAQLDRLASSVEVFPTPVNTICGGMNPARRATSISPPEFASTLLPGSGAIERSRASNWPSARSESRADTTRRPRRSRDTAPRSSRRCRRTTACRTRQPDRRAGRRRTRAPAPGGRSRSRFSRWRY